MLGYIQSYLHEHGPDSLRDKNVIVSSGLSNGYSTPGASLTTVNKELAELQQAGAHVTLLGASNEKPGLSELNFQLRALAAA